MAAPPPAAAVPHRCFAAAAAAGPQGEAPKAAMLVIGDEVLTGSITDANTPWLAKVIQLTAASFWGWSPPPTCSRLWAVHGCPCPGVPQIPLP